MFHVARAEQRRQQCSNKPSHEIECSSLIVKLRILNLTLFLLFRNNYVLVLKVSCFGGFLKELGNLPSSQSTYNNAGFR